MADDQTTVEASPVKSAKSLFATVVEVFSVVSAGAFLLSAMINEIIFATWGLNFLNIVSVGDIALSGLFLVTMIMFVSTPLVIFWAPFIGMYFFNRATPKNGKVVLLRIVPFYTGFMSVYYFTYAARNFYVDMLWSSIVGVLLASSSGLLMFSLGLFRNGSRGWSGVCACGFIVLAAAAIGFFAVDGGYQLEPTYMMSNVARCASPRVLWMGESAIVARCQNGKMLVIKGIQDARMIVG